MALLSTLLLAVAAHADVWWLEVEPWTPEPGGRVAVTLRRASGAAATDEPLRFQRLWTNGRAWVDAEFVVDRPGLQLLAFVSDETQPTHAAKALVVVGPTPDSRSLHLSELGHALEIVPQTDPVELVRGGGRLAVQVLFEREPLADVRVLAESIAADGEVSERREATTDEIGLASFELGAGALWRVRVVHRPRHGDDIGQPFSSTLSLVTGATGRR